MMNKVLLIGRLGQDPEVRFTKNGKAVATFTVATEDTWKDAQGQRQKKTEWHRCQAWGPIAELCGKYVSKGSLVYVEGALQTRSYEKDGTKRYVTEVNVLSIKFLSTNGQRDDGDDGHGAQDDDGDAPF